MTENHDYNTPEKGASDWHIPLNGNFEALDTDVEIRDTEASLGEYTPKDGAKFLATDTGAVYVGDGSSWTQIASTGPEPTFDAVTTSASGSGTRTEALVGVYEHAGDGRFDYEVSGLSDYDRIEVQVSLLDEARFQGGNFRYTLNGGTATDLLRGEDISGHGELVFQPIGSVASSPVGYSLTVTEDSFLVKMESIETVSRIDGFPGIETLRFFENEDARGKTLSGRIAVRGISYEK